MDTPRPSTSLDWSALLSPLSAPRKELLSSHSAAFAWHVDVMFVPWTLPEGDAAPSRKDTYGWKPQITPEFETPSRSVGEVELAQRLRAGDYSAFWIDSFGTAPSIWRSWARLPSELPRWATELDRGVRQHVLMRDYKTGGLPDVLAVHPSSHEYVFVEYKGPSAANPRKQDEISSKQDAWYRAALELGLLSEYSYLVARWVPNADSVARLQTQTLWKKPPGRAPAV